MTLSKEIIIGLFEGLGYMYNQEEDVFVGKTTEDVFKLPMEEGMTIQKLLINVRALYINNVWREQDIHNLKKKAGLIDALLGGKLKLEPTNRVEVIDEQGRQYTNYGCGEVELSMQDEGRTLKIFLENEKKNPMLHRTGILVWKVK